MHQRPVFLYRGGKQEALAWSTNPYDALRMLGEQGILEYVKLTDDDVRKLAGNVRMEGEFIQYVFKSTPPGVKRASAEQITQLLSKATFTKIQNNFSLQQPRDPIRTGEDIFG